jgi:hypothetical protein
MVTMHGMDGGTAAARIGDAVTSGSVASVVTGTMISVSGGHAASIGTAMVTSIGSMCSSVSGN